MQLFNTILLFSALIAHASAMARPEPDARPLPEAVSEPEPEAVAIPTTDDLVPRDLEKRACKYNGCKCQKVSNPGLYCWSCPYGSGWAVTTAGNTNAHPGDYGEWVFQCSKSGGCCTYGVRKSCASGNGPCGADS